MRTGEFYNFGLRNPMAKVEKVRENANEGEKTPQVTPFLVIPMDCVKHVLHTRKYKAFAFLFRLKSMFRQGGAIVPRGTLEETAFTVGVRTTKTMDKHLQYLQQQGLITYNRETGALTLKSLFKAFPGSKTGIRLFDTDNIKDLLFTALAGQLIKTDSWNKKRKSKKSGGLNPVSKDQPDNGVSLAFLSCVMEYSRTTISRMKLSATATDHLICRHRFRSTTITPWEFKYLSNEFPQEMRKYVKKGDQIRRQLTDAWYIFGIETVRRRYAA